MNGVQELKIVSGLGRCGSSLVMQMLDAAGVPVVIGNGPPAYEDEMQIGLKDVPEAGFTFDPRSERWLFDLAGSGYFFKLLDPQDMRLPTAAVYNVLWLDRDPREQALSQEKFLRFFGDLGRPMTRDERRALRELLVKERTRAFKQWTRLHAHVTRIRFEELIRRGSTVDAIARWAGRPDRADAMRGVIHARGPECLDYMLETRLPTTRLSEWLGPAESLAEPAARRSPP